MNCFFCQEPAAKWVVYRLRRVDHCDCWLRLGAGANLCTDELGRKYLRHDPVPPPNEAASGNELEKAAVTAAERPKPVAA